MADVPVGAVPAPEAPVVTQTRPQSAVNAAREARAAKLKEVSAGIGKLKATEAPVPDVSNPQKVEKLPSEKGPGEKVEAKPVVQTDPDEVETETPEQPATKEEPKLEAKPDEPDAQTKKALEAIDKQAKRFREEQATAKRELEQWVAEQRADIARRDAAMKERESKYGDVEKLKADARRNPIEHLRKFAGFESEEEWETVGRGAFPFTKAGKADPRSAEIAARAQKDIGITSEVAELRAELNKVREELATRDKQAETRTYIERWQSDAVKAIPTDKKTLIGNLHAKAPEKAKQALLLLGAELERANGGEAPEYADLIAEFEKRERAELEARGVDVDALLRPTPATPPATPPKKPVTLDPALPSNGTRPINGHPTREQKLAAVTAGIKRLEAEQQ